MSDFIISPYAISFESIRNNLQTFVKSKSSDEAWTDFYASSAGQTVIEIAAALGAFYAYHFITGRRESFISTAQNYTSLLGLAQNLGYSASRGNNLKLNIKIVPSSTETLPKWTVVGSYENYDVVLLEDVTFNKGVACTIPVVIGDFKEQSVSVTSADLTTFTFTNSDITNDYRLMRSRETTTIEVPTSSEIKDALNDKYICITNTYGGVDVFYLQQGTNYFIYNVTNGTNIGWVTTEGTGLVPYTETIYGNEYCSTTLPNYHSYIQSMPERLRTILNLDLSNYSKTTTKATRQLSLTTTLQNLNITTDAEIVLQTLGDITTLRLPITTSLGSLIDILAAYNIALSFETTGTTTYVTLDQSYGNFSYTGTENYYTYNYQHGDTLSLQFIERNSLTYTDWDSAKLTIDYASQVNTVTLTSDHSDIESSDSVRLKGPIYHETAMSVRSRKDYSKYLLQKVADIIQVNDEDIYPGLIKITYIKEDGSYLSSDEKTYWENAIYEITPDGVALANIEDSVLVKKDLHIKLWKTDDGTIDSTIGTNIRSILDQYHNTFEVTLDISEIEHEIELLDGIKIARVNFDEKTWKANTLYSLYDIIEVDDQPYYAYDFQYYTGSTEPTWPVNIGDKVVDGGIIWKKVDEFKDITLQDWQANHIFSRYDYIRKDFKVYGKYQPYSGADIPTWGDSEVLDGYLTWQRITEGEPTADWYPNTQYEMGDIIEVTSGENTYYYELIEIRQLTSTTTYIYVVDDYANYTGTSTPAWGSGDIEDKNIIWRNTGESTSISSTWSKNRLTTIGDEINVNGTLYRCVAYRRSTSDTFTPDSESLITDNEIRWKILDSETKLFSLAWNEHLELTFDYEIESD